MVGTWSDAQLAQEKARGWRGYRGIPRLESIAGAPAQFGLALTPAALITAPHFATSDSSWALKAAGVACSWPTGTVARPAKRSITLASFTASCNAGTSLSSASLGSPLGAQSACHADTSKPLTPDSSSVGSSASRGMRALVVAA